MRKFYEYGIDTTTDEVVTKGKQKYYSGRRTEMVGGVEKCQFLDKTDSSSEAWVRYDTALPLQTAIANAFSETRVRTAARSPTPPPPPPCPSLPSPTAAAIAPHHPFWEPILVAKIGSQNR